jgi:DEAD/DEAH box helicase domain-containing protein
MSSENPQRQRNIPLTGQKLEQTFPSYADQIRTVAKQEPTNAITVPADDIVRNNLEGRLDFTPYSHQATALQHLDADENVTVATSTSSGKTMVYALQIARNYLDNENTRALLLYPTKALSRDQERALNNLYTEMELDIRVEVYDGDTPTDDRREIRENANVIISNFSGINVYLGQHRRWHEFYTHCDLLAIDESHTYVGVHGMHVAWTIRRLRRVLDNYDSDPQIVCTTATVGNPAEHTEALTGKNTVVVDNDGSPNGKRDIAFWEPPLDADALDEDTGFEEFMQAKVSADDESTAILAHLGLNGVQSLMFTRSRQQTEIGARKAERAARDHPVDEYLRTEPYHAGLGKKTRRSIEYRLKSGQIDGVISTNALELGIDVGGVDATILTGYPGTRQSFWQQLGRSGRGQSDALSVLVARSDAIDQYILDNPDYLLEDAIEDAVIDLENNPVYAKHLLCAADELSLTELDKQWFGDERFERAVTMWEQAGKFVGDLDRGVIYDGSPRPQSDISMYNTSKVQFQVRCSDDDIDHEPVDRERAYRDYHEGSIFLHNGAEYEVIECVEDTQNPYVTVQPISTDEYTETLSDTDIHDLGERSRIELDNGYALCWGDGIVDIHYSEYQRREISTGKLVEPPCPTGLDPLSMHTQLMWIELPDSTNTQLVNDWLADDSDVNPDTMTPGDYDREYMGGIHAVEHGLIKMSPLELKMSKDDLGGLSVLDHPETGGSTLFIYDGVEGGLGFSKAIFEQLDAVGEKTKERIDSCDCVARQGCPCCVMDSNCGDDNSPLNTPVASRLLRDILTGLGNS